jgi:hypothetical protein
MAQDSSEEEAICTERNKPDMTGLNPKQVIEKLSSEVEEILGVKPDYSRDGLSNSFGQFYQSIFNWKNQQALNVLDTIACWVSAFEDEPGECSFKLSYWIILLQTKILELLAKDKNKPETGIKFINPKEV